MTYYAESSYGDDNYETYNGNVTFIDAASNDDDNHFTFHGSNNILYIVGDSNNTGGTITVGNGNFTEVLVSGGTGDSNDDIVAGNGNDTFFVAENSTVKVGNGNDTLYLGADVTATLGSGTDVIWVGFGNSVSVGTSGTGQDTFVFEQTTPGTIGAVSITHFNTASGVIDLESALGYSSFAALSPHITETHGNAVITLDSSGDTITLVGVNATHLQASNFHFA